jgi:P4 family phage/plasmid primase-like protien
VKDTSSITASLDLSTGAYAKEAKPADDKRPAPVPDDYPLADPFRYHADDPMVLARHFLKKYQHEDGPTIRFYRGSFFVWNSGTGAYAEQSDHDMATAMIRSADEQLEAEYDDRRRAAAKMPAGPKLGHKSALKDSTVRMALRCLASLDAVTIPAACDEEGRPVDGPIWLDPKKKPKDSEFFIALKNKLLDVSAYCRGEEFLFDHTPAYFTTTSLPFDYDPDAKCPTWERVARQNLGSESLVEFVREWMGYNLVPTARFQAAVVYYGTGGTGKSSLLAGLVAILGPKNVSSMSLEQIAAKHGTAGLVGRTANVRGDQGPVGPSDEGLFKSLVSGEPVPVEPKYKNFYSAALTTRFTFGVNVFPRWSDPTEGVWRRLFTVEFRRRVSKEEAAKEGDLADPRTWAKLGEVPGIFTWALRGLKRLLARNRFDPPAEVLEATAARRVEQFSALKFISEFCRPVEGAKTGKDELYSDYRRWALGEGLRPVSKRKFGDTLKSRWDAEKVELKTGKLSEKGRRENAHINVEYKDYDAD